jgi:hypothetical protein
LPLFSKEGYKGTFVLLEPITEGLLGCCGFDIDKHRFIVIESLSSTLREEGTPESRPALPAGNVDCEQRLYGF